MVVAAKSAVSTRKSQRLSAKARAVAELDSHVTPTMNLPSQGLSNRFQLDRSRTIPFVQSSRSVPLWLLRLCHWQRHSFIVMWLLVAGVLTVYSWTVYSQQKWNQAYRQLETLQLHKRQLVTTSEVLKNQMAWQAQQPDTGLVPPNPETAVVIEAAPQRPASATTSVIPINQPASRANQPVSTSIPLGY